MILLAITVTTILENRSKDSTDVRARASSTQNLEMTGVASSVDTSTGTIQVDHVKFKMDYGIDLGTWTVTPPIGFRITDARPGTTLTMKVKAETFLADNHTFSATEIKVK